jgi:copper chaperone CopZ
MRIARPLLALAALVVATSTAFAEGAPPAPPPPKTEVVYVEVTGLEEAKAPALAHALGAVEGVKSFAWTAPAKEAKVVREVGKAPDAALLGKAKDAGAQTAAMVPLAASTLTFEKPLHCAGCVKTVKTLLSAVKGVKDVVVPEGKTTVWVAYDTRAVKEDALRTALDAKGYATKS